jgi:hypothetical protein
MNSYVFTKLKLPKSLSNNRKKSKSWKIFLMNIGQGIETLNKMGKKKVG